MFGVPVPKGTLLTCDRCTTGKLSLVSTEGHGWICSKCVKALEERGEVVIHCPTPRPDERRKPLLTRRAS